MPHDDDFHVEPVRGLPETPPAGERILWQGAPHPWALATGALNARWIAGYFLALAVWRGTAVGTRDGALEGLVAASWFVAIGAVAVAVIALIAWVMARATVYTLTNRRVVMRIGAALTVTLNLPYQWIEGASLSRGRHGTGTIALALKGPTRISCLVLWPHCRPWRLRRPEPALRCIADAEHVAAILAAAACTRIAEVDGAATAAPAAHPIAAE
jgi:Bacterial PH domain